MSQKRQAALRSTNPEDYQRVPRAVAAMPKDFADDYGFEDKGVVVSGTVTSDITLVGVLGAWAFILGALLAIAAISLRSPRPHPVEVDA